MRIVLNSCRGAARVAGPIGALLVGAAISTSVGAADTPPRSWVELTAQHQRLDEQYQSLVAAGKADEALAAAEKLIETDRRVLEFTATDAAQKGLQQACRDERGDRLAWLVRQYCNRRAWSSAGKRQQELADFCEATYGKADFNTIDARNEQAYLARLAGLPPEEAGQLANADELNAKSIALYGQGKFSEAIPLAQKVARVRQRLLGDDSPRYADGLNGLALLYHEQGDDARAEPLYRQAMEIRKKALGENHPEYGQSLNNLAALYDAQGRLRGPNRCTSRRSISRRRPWGRTTPIMP